MGRLTSHVLDTAAGRPGANMQVELLDGAGRGLKRVQTNQDGRFDQPLLEGANLKKGRYVLRFHVADYFRKQGIPLADPPFLDVVDVPFGVADAAAHYHIPLLVSPYSFTTYRGS
jgi:5-hydroxyisourate hydrolase